MIKRLRAIDLFCGAGGSSYGARNAGVEIAAGFDIWEPAIKTFRLNFPFAKAIEGDIRQLSPQSVKSQIGNIDLILASPECTNHSRAKGSAERSEESRETAFQVVRFAETFRPKWMVIENVVDMKSWNRHADLIDDLWNLDYFVKEVTLNAKDFGVPQSRERLFILCSRTGEAAQPTPEHQPERFVRDFIDVTGKYDLRPLRSKYRAEKTIEAAERAIAALGDDASFLLVYYGSARNGSGGWQRIDEPLRTITTLDRFAYVTPSYDGHLMRMLQPEELKLAMGFNPDFRLSEVDGLVRRDRIKLMGNGVCPPVMEAIVKSLISQFA